MAVGGASANESEIMIGLRGISFLHADDRYLSPRMVQRYLGGESEREPRVEPTSNPASKPPTGFARGQFLNGRLQTFMMNGALCNFLV
jgi:hypothetical protein